MVIKALHGLYINVFLSGSGPAASNSEDRFTGSDNTQTRRYTGAVYCAEPHRHHNLNHAHPEHGPASPGIQLTRMISRFTMFLLHNKTNPNTMCCYCFVSLDADEQQHSDHRTCNDGRRRQAANQAAAARLHPLHKWT